MVTLFVLSLTKNDHKGLNPTNGNSPFSFDQKSFIGQQ
jgi:hypothetical protein